MTEIFDTSLNENGPKSDIVIEHRAKATEIALYIDEVLDDMTSLDYTIDHTIHIQEVYETLHEDLPDCNISIYKDIFVDDIVRLYTYFLTQTKNTCVRLQIEVIDSDMCRYFHVDKYRQRLLCTYKGPGTEWLDPSNVRLECLENGCKEHIVRDSDKIHRAGTFDVLLIKGSKYEGENKSVVHRSPPIAKNRIKRILLKIDERE